MEISEKTLQNVNTALDEIQGLASKGACGGDVALFYDIAQSVCNIKEGLRDVVITDDSGPEAA